MSMKLCLKIFALIGFLVLYSCTSSVSGNGSQVGNPIVTGCVLDSLNYPIVNANIVMRPYNYTVKDSVVENRVYTTNTDEDGKYQFIIGLDTGSYIIEIVQNDSLKAIVEKFKIERYDSLIFNSIIGKTGDIKGVIKNSFNSNVYLLGLNEFAKTDSVGFFNLSGIPNGVFSVLIENTSYDSTITIDNIEVLSEQSVDIGVIEFDENNPPYNLKILIPISDTCYWDSFDNVNNIGNIEFRYSSSELDTNDISLYLLYFGEDSLNLEKIYEGVDTLIFIDSIKPETKYFFRLFVTDLVDTQDLSSSFSTIKINSIQSYISMNNKSFIMGNNNGDSDELIQHEVMFNYDVLVDKSEVSQLYYAQIMNSIYDTLIQVEWDTLLGKGDSFPAYYVNWFEAALFCNARSKIEGLDSCYAYKNINVITDTGVILDSVLFNFSSNGYRLPTEAEWEFICRAYSTGEYYWNDSVPENYAVFNQGKLNKINSKVPNNFNLYDINGNVWEWCNDFYDENYYAVSDSINPQGPINGLNKVIRGGSWSGDLHSIRITDRFGYSPKTSVSDGGFRCLRKIN